MKDDTSTFTVKVKREERDLRGELVDILERTVSGKSRGHVGVYETSRTPSLPASPPPADVEPPSPTDLTMCLQMLHMAAPRSGTFRIPNATVAWVMVGGATTGASPATTPSTDEVEEEETNVKSVADFRWSDMGG